MEHIRYQAKLHINVPRPKSGWCREAGAGAVPTAGWQRYVDPPAAAWSVPGLTGLQGGIQSSSPLDRPDRERAADHPTAHLQLMLPSPRQPEGLPTSNTKHTRSSKAAGCRLGHKTHHPHLNSHANAGDLLARGGRIFTALQY